MIHSRHVAKTNLTKLTTVHSLEGPAGVPEPQLGTPYPEVGGGVAVTQPVTPPSTYCQLG